jgi:hypothetical protein
MVRDRFAESLKKYEPLLETSNLGMESPNKHYDLTEAYKKVAKSNIKREN